MQDDLGLATAAAPRIDARVLRHMMHEAIDLLDLSAEHADEACSNTDAAMTLTRNDWMLMAVFNWLTRQLRTDDAGLYGEPLGDPIPVLGIDQNALSDELRLYAHSVDRLHARVKQLESLITATTETRAASVERSASGKVLHIFGDPVPGSGAQNAVRESRQRLKSAFGGN